MRAVGAALVVLAAVVASAPAVGSSAFAFDRTMSCARPAGPVVSLEAHASFTIGQNSTSPTTFPSVAAFTNGPDAPYGGLTASTHGYGFSGDACTSRARPIPLSSAGLKLVGVFRPGDEGLGAMTNPAHCVVGKRVVVRIHAAVGDGDTPTSGSLALRAGSKTLKPLAFVAWTPQRVRVFLARSCNS